MTISDLDTPNARCDWPAHQRDFVLDGFLGIDARAGAPPSTWAPAAAAPTRCGAPIMPPPA